MPNRHMNAYMEHNYVQINYLLFYYISFIWTAFDPQLGLMFFFYSNTAYVKKHIQTL